MGKVGGKRRMELHPNPATPEGCRLGQKNQPLEAKILGALSVPQASRIQGGNTTKEKKVGYFAPGRSKLGSIIGNHKQWHESRGVSKPEKCLLCQGHTVNEIKALLDII